MIDPERTYQNYKRRTLAMRESMDIPAWSRRALHEFLNRLVWASRCEGICDLDLKVLVRMYNREVLGRAYHEKEAVQKDL